MKRLTGSTVLAALLLVSSLALAGTTGALRGVVSDAATHAPAAGVTVIATSNALQGKESAVTDARGRYVIKGLPPGTYQLRFEFGGVSAERSNVGVSIDQTITVNVDIMSSAAGIETITIVAAAPTVDVATTSLGVTVTRQFIENVPLGRSRNFDEALSVLPSASRDEFGVSVSGASSPENAYFIDGLNTTDPSFGLLGSRLVLDFVDQLELKEGGYNAEYGRATGGMVNIVTKSGSNEFHGTVFSYYRPGALEADRKLVIRAGESIGTRPELGYYLNTGFEVGGPIIKDKLWFHVGYAPEIQSDLWWRDIYAREVAADGGPVLDKYGRFVTTKVQSNKFDSRAVTHHYRAKLTHLINDNQRHSLSLNGAPTFFTGARQNPFDPNSPTIALNGNPDTFLFKEQAGSLDGNYKYAGKFLGDTLQVEASLGYHGQKRVYEPSRAGVSELPRITYQYARDLRDVQASEVGVPQACDETFTDGSPRCVVEGYNRGGFGLGLLRRIFLNRWSETAAVTHVFDFAGLHQVKYGLDLEQNTYRDRKAYSGGGFYNLYDAGGLQYFVGQEFFAVGDTTQPVDHLNARTGTHNWSLFLQDSWDPMPTFTLNYGVRWEAQEFYGVKINEDGSRTTEKKFGIYDNLAPRVGAVWDFLGNARSKAFVHWGRFYESVPLDLMDRYFAGEGIMIPILGVDGDFNDAQCREDINDPTSAPLTKEQVTNPRQQCPVGAQYTFGGTDNLVAPGLKGQYSDETIIGVEVEVLPSWVVGFSGIYRNLGRVIEDLSTDGGGHFIIANPGQFDSRELDDLAARIAAERDPDRRAELETLRQVAAGINDFRPASRNFYGLQLELNKKIRQNSMVRASYLLSWTHGNYPGLFADHNLQLDPNGTTQYDLPSLTENRDGYLPSDRRHRIKIDGYYQANLEDLGFAIPLVATLGAAVRAQSGKPINALGADPLYQLDEVFLLPRGVAGRTPWTWSGDLHLAARYNFGNDLGAEAFVDLFNVTNNQQTLEVDQRYTTDYVLPIKDGTVEDLPFAKNTSGAPVNKNPNYKEPIAYQAPISGQFGLRLFF